MKTKWLKAQLRDLIELFVLPGMSMFLPWKLCFGFFKLVCRCDFLYRAQSTAVLSKVQGFDVPGLDAQQFAYQRRLVTLVDHADMFLVWTRGRKWLDKFVVTQGQWPAADSAAVLCTFHWGAGMWCLRDARLKGLKAHILVASLKKENFRGRPVLHWYAKLRTDTIARELGRATIDASQTLRSVLKALKSNEQIMAVVDVPADAVAGSTQVSLLGQTASVPKGLLRVAADNKIPVTVFTVGVCLQTGTRRLQIHTLPVEQDTDVLIPKVFAFLDAAIKDAPPAWHFWSEVDRFFLGSRTNKEI
jgi:hypothetical protein